MNLSRNIFLKIATKFFSRTMMIFKNIFFQGNDARLYEFIVRHFLATCSKDAQGQETTVTINIADEMVISLADEALHFICCNC